MRRFMTQNLFIIISIMILTLTGCKEGLLAPPSPSPTVKLVSIHINSVEKALGATEATIPVGYTQRYAAEGMYSDNTVKDITDSVSWHSSDKTIASMSANIATGVSSGDTIITATLGDISSNQSGLKITDAILLRIQLTAANADKGTSTLIKGAKGVPLIAMGTFSNDTQLDIAANSENDWEFNSDFVLIKNGVASGIAKGDDTISVRQGDVVSNDLKLHVKELKTITISSEKDQTPVGFSIAFKASGEFSDKTPTGDITSQVVWKLKDEAIATFSGNELTGKAVGSTTVTAEALSVTSDSVSVTVTNAVITKLTLSNGTNKDTSTIYKGREQDYTVMATYSNNTTPVRLIDDTAVKWNIIQSKIASKVPDKFALYGDNMGETDLTVSTKDDTVSSNKVNLKVTDAELESIAITPDVASVYKSGVFQLTATGSYTDGSTKVINDTVEWSNTNDLAATIDLANTITPGLLHGVSAGTTKVTATLDKITSKNEVTVTVCGNLGSTCIDIFDANVDDKLLFTNDPSKLYVDNVDGIVPSDPTKGILEDGRDGNPFGYFYAYDQDEAKKLCDFYARQALGGRNNWDLPTQKELLTLFNTTSKKGMSSVRGWPTTDSYWTKDVDETPDVVDLVFYKIKNLSNGTPDISLSTNSLYVSCISR